METKWIAIAVAICVSTMYGAIAIDSFKKSDVKIACFQAQAKSVIDLKCDKL